MERDETVTDRGGELVQIRNLADGDEFWTKRRCLRRHDGCWVLLAERQLHMLTVNRQRAATRKALEAKSEELESTP